MIFTEYPGHLVALVLVTVSLAVLALAFRTDQLAAPQRRGYRWLLAALHCVAVLLLLVILWNPSVRRQKEVFGRNAVLTVFDTSESMSIADDGRTTRLDKSLAKFAECFDATGRTGPEYRIHGLDASVYHCGSASLLRRWGRQSSLHEAISLIADSTASGESAAAQDAVAGAVIFTDGRADDRDVRRYLPIQGDDMPVLIVGVGSRTARPDLAIKALSGPAITWADTPYETAAVVAAGILPTGPVTLELVWDGKAIQTVQIPPAQFHRTDSGLAEALVELAGPAGPLGTHVLTVRAKPLRGEINLANNSRSASVEVTQERSLRVLLYTQWATFDTGKLRQALAWDKRIRLDFAFDVIQDRPIAGRTAIDLGYAVLPQAREGFHEYDVIILGPCDVRGLTAAQWDGLYSFVTERGGGLLLLAGRAVASLANGGDERARTLLPAVFGRDDPRLWPPARDAIHASFEAQVGRLFDPNAFADPRHKISPYYGIANAKPASTALATAGETPILLTHRVGRGRVCLLNASKLFTLYRADLQGGALAEMICGLVAYLGRTPARGAGIELFAERASEDPTSVVFNAYVVDRTFRPAGGANVLLTAGERVVSMEPTAPGYYRATLDWGTAQSMVATAQAELNGTFLGERTLAANLPPVRDEMSCVDLDEPFLRALAERVNARYVYIDDLEQKDAKLFVPRRQTGVQETVTRIWPRWSVLVALCAMLSAGWFIRRAIGLV
ncbi:MAG: hypothetical protein KBE65_09680 [Phycisphaerae bacterium]|nr:hypothetical protein [Phycisphaerae bacterium]